jgi:hypothetical protein
MVANLVSKQDPKIARNLRISWENWNFPSPKLLFSSHKIRFSSMVFWFPRNLRKSSSMAFQFLQRLFAFFNGFPLSKKSEKIFFNGFPISSMAFRFLQRLSSSKLFISWIICSASKLFISWIICHHSPHSLASVKDMYVEMGFQLNLYQHWKHFSLYYDGQFDDLLCIAHGFNQLQRTCCIPNLARITDKSLTTLRSLGVLANQRNYKLN